MPNSQSFQFLVYAFAILCALVGNGHGATPVLNTVFPSGARCGETVEIEFSGSGMTDIASATCTAPGISFVQDEKNKNRFSANIPVDTPVGFYELRVLCRDGLSSSRPFVIGNRNEVLEVEPNEDATAGQTVAIDSTINGRIEKKGDVDYFRFAAKAGQRVVIEGWAERIDSRLRAILEVLDEGGRRLASSRGYFGIDPMVDFRVPGDGIYIVKLYDLVFAGGGDYYYRLDIDTRPRIAFAVSPVVTTGKPARVKLYGWNLSPSMKGQSPFDEVVVEIPAHAVKPQWPLPFRMQSTQTSIKGFPFYLPNANAPVFIGTTDVSAVLAANNQTPNSAQKIVVPCEVSGQLIAGSQEDWFSFEARRGEVFYIEGIGQRIGSPLDLDLRILDSTGDNELAQFGDELRNLGGKTFPTSHVDPVGRWVAPKDGRFLVLVRNVTGGPASSFRNVYRLSIRREESDFSLVAVPHDEKSAFNVQRNGRTVFEVIALRSRGHNDAIQVSARQLPSGIHCPDIWIGPGVNRATMVVSADKDAKPFAGRLELFASSTSVKSKQVRGGMVVRTGTPNGWSRLSSEIPLAIAGDSSVRITANGHETRDHHLYGDLTVRHSPGGVLDIAVRVDRTDEGHRAPVKLTGVGVPGLIANQIATIPAGQSKGYISFYLPPNLPPGKYSLAVRGETSVADAKGKPRSVVVHSNVVVFKVHPPAFILEIDPEAPRQIKRGEVVQVKYSVRRVNGFISKIHTELATPDKVTDVPGLRGRGVSSVGGAEAGTIQIIANDDAPLGQQPFLRIYGVGTLEDEAKFHGSCFLNLEVTE